MQMLIYIFRNVRRNKLRAALTILSFSFSLALLTVLFGYMAMQDVWSEEAEKHHRIVVMNIQGFAGMLPISYVDRVRQMPGVIAAVPYSWYGGTYKEEKMPFAQFGTDASAAFDVWSEYRIDPEQLEAWKKNRRGCVVDRRLAEKRGWKIGERIPLKGNYYPFHLDLELVGIFETPEPIDSLWFHWEYLDEGMRQMNFPGTGNAGTIFARTENAAAIPRVTKLIDDYYASSENPTRTQSEAAFAQMFTEMLGNFRLYILVIGLAVVFALTLVAATGMAMSMRERTTEIAVLKAIGFSRPRVLAMVLGESCSITLMGGLLGIALGCLCLEWLHQLSSQFFPLGIADMAGPWLLNLELTAAVIGLVSGFVPAIQAAQLSVVNGLRRVV